LQQHEEYHSTMTQAKIATSSNWEKWAQSSPVSTAKNDIKSKPFILRRPNQKNINR
jgi:hypothetical protein